MLHPGTCTFQRSQPACTFRLLCYLAGGLPVGRCENNVALTCCMLNSQSKSAFNINPQSHLLILVESIIKAGINSIVNSAGASSGVFSSLAPGGLSYQPSDHIASGQSLHLTSSQEFSAYPPTVSHLCHRPSAMTLSRMASITRETNRAQENSCLHEE